MSTFKDFKLCFRDKTSVVIEKTTSSKVQDGCLHLFRKDGEMAPNEHLGSWPLDNVRAYYTRDSFSNDYKRGPKEWPE